MKPDQIPLALTFDDVLLVPQRSAVKSRRDVVLETRLTRSLALSIPIVSANTPFCTEAPMAIGMALAGGIGIVHRMCTIERQVEQVRRVKERGVQTAQHAHASLDSSGRLIVGAAVGVTNDYEQRAQSLIEAGIDVIVVDIAHGHASHALNAIALFKSRYPRLPVVGGNVATRAGTRDLISAGADAVKVGIGPGSICTTRVVAGVGVPQLTAIMDCAEEARRFDIPVIADGGLRTSGDMVKALAAGASTVMLGGALAGCDESCSILIERGGRRHKSTTGFVTFGVGLTLKRAKGERITREELESYVPEGIEATYPYQGALAGVLKQYLGGIRSGFSYSGASNVAELWERAQFVRTTQAGIAESQPHALARSTVPPPDFSVALNEVAQ